MRHLRVNLPRARGCTLIFEMMNVGRLLFDESKLQGPPTFIVVWTQRIPFETTERSGPAWNRDAVIFQLEHHVLIRTRLEGACPEDKAFLNQAVDFERREKLKASPAERPFRRDGQRLFRFY